MADSNRIVELDCERARAEVHAFLGSFGGGAKSAALRAHLGRCVECDAYYREQVVGVARIASGARVAAEVRHDDEVETQARRSLIAAGAGRRFRLPKSVLPLAVVALVAALVMKSGAQTVTLRTLEGTVYRGAQLIERGEAVAAANGDGCSTGADGRVELARAGDSILIDPNSSFTIERLDRVAIRLFDGCASVNGSALIVCSSGALEVQLGSARVTVDDAGIAIESRSGLVEYSDASGRAVIPAGSTKNIEHVHVAAQR